MALYHFHVSRVLRSRGQSSVEAAAYRAGEKLSDFFVPFSARGIDDMCQMFILKTNFQVR